MILIFNGPCGVGKSTISKNLAKRFENCVYINADDIRNSIIGGEINPTNVKVTDLNICCMVENFKRFGFDNIIIENVYEEDKHINEVISNLSKFDSNIMCFLLYCNLEENIKRDKLRPTEEICGEKRVTELYNIFQSLDKKLWNKVDISSLLIKESVEKIYNIINRNRR